MPYLADGTFTPDQPITTSGAPLNALAQPLPQTLDNTPPAEGMQAPVPTAGANVPFNPHTGQPRYENDRRAYGFAPPVDALKGASKTTKTPPPGFAHMDVPSFPEYVQFAAKRDSTADAAVDPSTMDDASYIKYAKEYAETMGPQAIINAGHKFDPADLKTVSANYQYAIAKDIDKFRNHFKQNQDGAPATAPKESYGVTDALKDIGAGAAAGVPKTAATFGMLTQPIAAAMGHSIASLASTFGFPDYAARVEQRIKEQTPEAMKAIADTAQSGEDIANKYASAHTKALLAVNADEAAKDEANPDLTTFDKAYRSAGRALMSPSLLPEQLGEMLPALTTGAKAAKVVGFGIKQIAQSEAPSFLKAIITKLGGEGLAKSAAATAFGVPMAGQTLANIGTNAFTENYKQSGDTTKATEAAHTAMTSPGAVAAVAAALAPVGAARVFGGAEQGIGGVLARTLGQGAQGAVMSGGSTAAENVAAGRPDMAGVASSAGSGAAAMLPVALGVEALGAASGHGTPKVQPKPGAAEVPGAGGPGAPPPAAGAESTPVQMAVKNAMEEVPPPAKPFASPEAAQSHYAKALAAFKGDLRNSDIPPEEAAGMVPAFDKAWSDATGHDPKTGQPIAAAEAGAAPPVDEVAAAAAKAPPDGSEPPTEPEGAAPSQPGLDLGGIPGVDLGGRTSIPEAAAAREAVAADHLPDGVRTRVTADLKKQLGRDPTNSEIARQGGHLIDIALDQQGINRRLPRAALEEAVGELMGKSKTFPDVDAINDLARKKTENPNQEKIKYQEGLNLEPPKGSDSLKKGFDKIAAREAKERAAALKQKKTDTIAAQDIENDSERTKREKEINDAYDQRVKEAGDQAQKERDNAHASAEREREIAEHAEREAEAAKERDVLKRKKAVKKAKPEAESDTASGTEDLASAVKEDTPGHPREGWMRKEATPEEQAKLAPLERYFRQFKNVKDMLVSLGERVTNAPHLKLVIEKLLANPYLREKLAKTPFRVYNPGDAGRTQQTDGIGNYGKMVPGGYHSKNTFGSFNLGGGSGGGVVIAGSKWAPYTALYNGLNPLTPVHEAVHAAIGHLLDKHESDLKAGRPTDPVLDAAYQQLEEFRFALEKSGVIDTATNPHVKEWLNYASTNVHELISVVLTDPNVQAYLKTVKMGQVTAWKRMVGIVSKFLGMHEKSEQSALDHVMEQANKFIDYKPTDFVASDLHSSIESPEAGLTETLYSRQSDRVGENTADKVIDAISVKAPQDRIKQENEIAKQQNRPTRAGEWEKKIFDKLKPLTQAIQNLVKSGITVGARENIDNAARVYQNLSARAINIAQQQFIQPAVQKIVELAGKSNKSSEEFLTHLSAWYFGKRALEVNDRGELEHARLTKDAEVKRQAIRDDWAAGKIPAGEYLDRLRDVVEAPGAKVANRSPLSKSGITDEVAHELISKAKRNGITPGIISQFEPHRQAMLEEIDRNYQRSGRFSTFDAARRKALGSKYYVPLKGFGMGDEELPSSGLGAFTREYTGAQGRSTIAQNPLVNLMQEVQSSARDVPENNLTKTVYNFARKYGKQFGITIRDLDVESEVKDAIAAGGTVGDIGRSFKNPNTVIHNNGEFRHSIEFPEGSPILEALKSINESRELNTFERTAGTVTNIIARGATTLNPKFLFWNAFWRDTGYVGAQIGMDLGPAATAQYAARYWLQGGPLRGRSTYFSGLKPRNSLERDAYAATGRSKFAQSLSEIAKYGGDLSFENELNTVRNMDSVYEALKKAEGAKGIVDRVKAFGTPLIHWLDQIGTSDIMTARVAAYETYVDVATRKLGHEPSDMELTQIKKDGALYSRRILDYQQRSDISRSLNIVYPFARVVMTQTDRLLETFKNADGSYNMKKVAGMTALGLLVGATYYSLLRQANPDIKKQENNTLSQNFVIPVGNTIVHVPMAYGLTRLFLVPGMMAARAAFGDSSSEDATNEIRNALIEGFLPFKPPEAPHNEKFHDEVMDLVASITPGAMRPFLEIERNKNVFGSQITPMDDRVKGPHYQGGFNSTPDTWKWLAKMLHDTSGGAVDVYPESLEYLTGAYGTGLGNAFMRAASIETKGTDDLNPQKLPFVPAVTSRDAEFYERRQIENLKEDLENKGKPLPKNSEKKEKGIDYLSEQETEILKSITAMDQKYGKQRGAIYRNEILSTNQRQALLKQVTAQQRAEQNELLKRAQHAK